MEERINKLEEKIRRMKRKDKIRKITSELMSNLTDREILKEILEEFENEKYNENVIEILFDKEELLEETKNNKYENQEAEEKQILTIPEEIISDKKRFEQSLGELLTKLDKLIDKTNEKNNVRRNKYRTSYKDITCYTCGRKGHTSTICYENRNKERKESENINHREEYYRNKFIDEQQGETYDLQLEERRKEKECYQNSI